MNTEPGRRIDHYADGALITSRRRQKAEIIGEALRNLLPEETALELVDFGCADGAIPVLLLKSALGNSVARITGITLLDYNDLPEKRTHVHERFRRIVANLEGPLENTDLPWGACQAVTATAFLPYLRQPEAAFRLACRLLRPGGYLLVSLPARWVLAVRQWGLTGRRNERIRHRHSLNWWAETAGRCRFQEVSRQAVQWLGIDWSAGFERWLRARSRLCRVGSNYLVIYREAT